MNRILSFTFLAALAALAAPAAFAMSHVDVVGVANDTTFTESGGNEWSHNGLGLGGGAVLGLSMSKDWDFEFGALYAQRKVEEDVSGATTQLTANGFEIPVGVRYWLASMLSIGAGGYLYHFSSATVTLIDDASGNTVSGTSDLSGNDYGIYGSVKLRLPLSMMTGFVIDVRYNLGLKETSGSNPGKFDDVQALVGFSFGL